MDAEIFRLALPALGALVAEPLFLLADSAIVGHLGTEQLAGLGVAGAVLGFLVSACVFLAYGTTATVARRWGAGDVRGALGAGVSGMWLAGILGVGLAVLCVLLARPLAGLVGTGGATADYATIYLRLAGLGLPADLLAMAAVGVLRGLHQARTPLVVATVGAGANVLLNLVLVYPLGMGVAGSALGTLLIQIGIAGVYLAAIVREARRRQVALSPDRDGLVAAASAGVPLILRTMTLRSAIFATTFVAGRQGTSALAAHQVALTVWIFLSLVLDAVAIAGQAIIGRYLGAGNLDAARCATDRMSQWGLGTGSALGLSVFVASRFFPAWFSPDPRVQALLAGALAVAAVWQPVCGVVFALDGILIGAGDGLYLAGAAAVALVAFVPLAAAVALTSAGLTALWWAFGAFLGVRLATLLPRARGEAWMTTGAVGRTPPPRLSFRRRRG